MKCSLVVALLVAMTLAVGGCGFFQRTKTPLLACGEDAIQRAIPSLVPLVLEALERDSLNWQPALEELFKASGDAALCALQVVVKDLERDGGGPQQVASLKAEEGPSRPEKLARARSFLAKSGR